MTIPTTMSTSWEYDVAQNFYMNDELSMTSELEMSHEVIGYGRLLTDYGEVDVLQVRRVERQTVVGFILEIEEYELMGPDSLDRKSTRLNSSHVAISYAVFCLKKKIIK